MYAYICNQHMQNPGIILQRFWKGSHESSVSDRLPPPSCTGRPAFLLLCCYISCYFHFTAQRWNSRAPLSRWAAFFYCNMPTVRPLSHEESQKKVDFLLLYYLTIYSWPLSHGGNNKRFDFHLLYYSFSQKEKENSCNFISGL